MSSLRRRPRASFTLIEVLLALVLFGMVMALSYEILNVNLATSDRVEKVLHRVEIGPAILHTIEQDLRCALLLKNQPVAMFVGQAGAAGPDQQQIDFLCTRSWFDSTLNAVADYSSVGYRMQANSGGTDNGYYTLYRRARRVVPMTDPNPLKTGTMVPVYTRVSTFKLRYYDGTNWQDTWDSKQQNAYPKAVEITLTIGYDDGDPQNTDMTSFLTDVLLPQ